MIKINDKTLDYNYIKVVRLQSAQSEDYRVFQDQVWEFRGVQRGEMQGGFLLAYFWHFT